MAARVGEQSAVVWKRCTSTLSGESFGGWRLAWPPNALELEANIVQQDKQGHSALQLADAGPVGGKFRVGSLARTS